MARGLFVRLTIQNADDINVGLVAAEAANQNQRLSELESTKFLPAAVEAAKLLIGAFPAGPYFVTFNAIDSFGVHGEATLITVSVDTAATVLPVKTEIAQPPSTEVNESTADPAKPASVEPSDTPTPEEPPVNG